MCADLPRAERFYCDVLGYRVVWRPDADNCYLTRGRDNLALHTSTAHLAETRLDHFGFLLESANCVRTWADHIRGCGVALDSEVRTHRDGSTSFYVKDPEGNRVQFLHLGPAMTD